MSGNHEFCKDEPQGQPFALLADPTNYIACDWNLTLDHPARDHWIGFFKRHLLTILQLGTQAAVARGESEASVSRRAEACRREFDRRFDQYHANPSAFGPVTILTLDDWRDNLLRQHGFVDAFIDLKNRENEKVLPLLPVVCHEIDSHPVAEQLDVLIRGIFAGNIFDMGAEATARSFLAGGPDFFAVRERIAPRPWVIDDYDALASMLLGDQPIRKAVYFIDNAGSDFILGALPFMRWLARRGTQVVLAANERPTLNDMTIHDVHAWWNRIVDTEPSLKGLPIMRVSTGTGEPLIDLSRVSPEMNRAALGADLVILEGMGRGVESNLHARFTCRALNVAMIKDVAVANRVGGKMYDCVCRFR